MKRNEQEAFDCDVCYTFYGKRTPYAKSIRKCYGLCDITYYCYECYEDFWNNTKFNIFYYLYKNET